MKKERMKWSEIKEWIGNKIGDEGAKAIGEALMINTSLTSLKLASDEKIWNEKERRNEKEEWIDNQIGYEGAQSISGSLKINTSLTTLYLWSDEKS